jgi:hypothetical protein
MNYLFCCLIRKEAFFEHNTTHDQYTGIAHHWQHDRQQRTGLLQSQLGIKPSKEASALSR